MKRALLDDPAAPARLFRLASDAATKTICSVNSEASDQNDEATMAIEDSLQLAAGSFNR
jgi:hypothetical protein